MSYIDYFCNMKELEEITFQTLTNNEDIQIGYSDNDIIVVDSIQRFAEISAAHVSMNAIAICTQGKVQGSMNGQQIELHQNQVAIIPQNITVTDVMISPDFDLKGLFLTNSIKTFKPPGILVDTVKWTNPSFCDSEVFIKD